MSFADRRDAGRKLARLVARMAPHDPVVIGLPRGGVPVAAAVAAELGAPLDVLVVRKLGCPWQPELGVGAISEDGVEVRNHDLIERLGLTERQVDAVAEEERAELDRRVRRYRGGRPPVHVRGRTAVLVDDGLATGSTARAAIVALRRLGAGRVVLAVPVMPSAAVGEMSALADDVVAVSTPERLSSIGEWYSDFRQTSDDEVASALAGPARGSAADRRTSECVIPAGDVRLAGTMDWPAAPLGAVVFAHGSGSGRASPRNLAVARSLNESGLATLLFDLLTEAEARDRANVFDIELLARRLVQATAWLRGQPDAGTLPIGYFGASTGAAAALVAAAELGEEVGAVVSRGGRPDLAGGALARVTAPTLLVVGGRDPQVLELNRRAQRHLAGPSHLEVVGGATHLFSEPGALEAVAELARDWFVEHLGR
jgi:putative phosphoribosyl transferase